MKVLAIDIGTASISAAVAERDQRGKFFVHDVWRLSYDYGNKEAGKILIKNLDRAFFDVSKSHPIISKVFFGFSSPFYLEKTTTAEFERTNPEILISENELERDIKTLKNQIYEGVKVVSCDVLETKINGYFVEDPLGHSGETLEIKANFLILGTLLKNSIEELKDKYFPASEFKFFSDSSVIKKAVFNLFFPKGEFSILDIGGEVSVLGHYIIPFGLCNIERRIPQSFLQRFSSGHLDYPHERAINKILKSYSGFLLDTLKEYKFSKIFLTGAGANLAHFFEIIKENSAAEIKTVKAEDFNKFFSKLNSLSGGGDAVLTSLITLYA